MAKGKGKRRGRGQGDDVDRSPGVASLGVRLIAFVALAAGAGGAAYARSQQALREGPRPRRAADAADAAGRRPEPTSGGIMGRLERIGRRFPPFGVALRVQKRFGELHGNNLAAAVTLQVFISLFPLLLVAIAVVGFFSANADTNVAAEVVGQLGLTGDSAELFTEAVGTAEGSRRAASVVGLAFLAWSSLGVAAALQYGYNTVWQAEGRGLKDKVFGVVWFLGFAVAALVSGAITTVLRLVPDVSAVLGVVVGLAINFTLFLWTMKVLPNRDVGWKPLVPGALMSAVLFEALKAVAAFYVPRAIENSSALYGSIGAILAVLGFLLLLGRVLIYASVLNVVLYERRAGTHEVVLEVPNAPGYRDDPRADRTGQVDPVDKDRIDPKQDPVRRPGHTPAAA